MREAAGPAGVAGCSSEPPNARHVVWRLAAELRLTSCEPSSSKKESSPSHVPCSKKEGSRLFLFAQSRCPCGAARHALFRSAFSPCNGATERELLS